MKNTHMSNYLVIEATNLSWLESKVRPLLDLGYEPLGAATPVYTCPDNTKLHERANVDFNSNKSYQSIMYIQTLYKPANKITLV